MFDRFTARKPKPRKAAVAPLEEAAQAAPKLEAAPAPEAPAAKKPKTEEAAAKKPKELGGPGGPEPTRYGDWERKGICVDF